jgi:hypothetical protein
MKENIADYFDKIASERDKWKRKNRYYYAYLNNLIDFFIPKGKKVLRIEVGDSSFWKSENTIEPDTYDYVVAMDVLGYINSAQEFMERINQIIKDDGRIIITQYNALWEPILRLASRFGLRMPSVEQNWLSLNDLKNLSYLAGFEVIKSGTKMLMPKYIPLLSVFMNKIVANIFPFSRLGIFHYFIARKQMQPLINPSLSIIVPARNESGTIEKIVKELPLLGSSTEIIFIEGNSTDNTFDEIVRITKKYKDKRIIKYAKQEGKGKGDAVRKGFEMASGDILAIYDADMTVPADEIEKFYKAIVENRAEFVNGSRLVYPLEKDSMRLLNYFANKFFGFAFSAILGQQIKDTLCGTKVLWKKDYEDIKKNRSFFGDFDPFGDFDLLFGAAKLNRKIVDLPIHYKERIYGTTNINRWKHGWLLLKMTIFAARKMKFI